MNNRRRALLLFVAAAVVVAGVAVVRFVRRPPTIASARLVLLPGAKERIAKFPELMRLSKVETRPAAKLPGLPFALDDSPKTAVTPTVERQTLLGSESLAPRPPQAIIAAYRGRADLSDAERSALIGALLDAGQVDDAVAVQRARVTQAADDEDAHHALLALLDEQNRVADWLVANETYFQLLLRKGRAAPAAEERDRLAAAAAAALDARRAMGRRAIVEAPGLDALRVTLIDAFPQNAKLLTDYVAALLADKNSAQAQAVLAPRLARYPEGSRSELWDLAMAAYRAQGQSDRLLRLLEETAAQSEGDEILLIYGRLLADANLAEIRRSQLLDALKTAPDAANLRALAALELARGRGDLARDELTANATRLGADGDPKTLLLLSALAERAGLGGLAGTWAVDAALSAGEGRPEIWLAAARRVAQGGDAAAWPMAISPAGAFNPAFADRGPGVIGGLLSLGSNRMGARAAMNGMPAAGARYGNRQLAVEMALKAAERSQDSKSCYEAAAVAADVMTKAGLADPLTRLADRLLARFGERQESAGRILLWYADAAFLRVDDEAQIAALRRVVQTARALGQEAPAADAQGRLEKLLLEKSRYAEVLALKWENVEHFPKDEAAMKDLLDFAEEHRLFDDEARAYRLAIERFNRKNWSDKFARWLLREKRRAEFEQLATTTAHRLGEGELADFLAAQFKETAGEDAGDVLFEKLYAIALGRFPANVAVNLRLLDYYERRGFGAHPQAAYQDKFLDLGMRCFALDPQIPGRVLQRLAQRQMLRGMLAKLAQARTVQPVEAYLWTRGQEFLADYEAARHGYAALAQVWPDRLGVANAQATVDRSLARSFHIKDPALTLEAAAAWDRLAVRRPLEMEPRTLQGEVLLEGGRARDAAAAWEKIPAAAPGEPERWLNLATLYWDYYLPAQAQDALAEARVQLRNPNLHATEMAYLLEIDGRLDDALAELVKAVGADGADGREAGEHLRSLIERGKTTTAAVDAAFSRGIDGAGANDAVARSYVDWLREGGRSGDAKAAALKLLSRYNEVGFAEAVLPMFTETGDFGGAQTCLERIVAISKRDPAMLRRLAAFFESRHAQADADKIVAELLAAQSSGAQQDAWQYAADYFWRTDRRDAALNYYRRLAETAGDVHQAVSRWIVYAEHCLEAGQPDPALAALAKLRRDQPTDPAIVGTMAKAYAAKGDREGLAALYQSVLQDLKKADLGATAKKDRESELRGKLIAALTDLGRFREAIEEHIQIINRNAPAPEPVLAAYHYAKRHNQLAPLLAYYEREAERASRDYRWSLVAGILYDEEGRYADAAHMYDKASAVEPQKLDLAERRAQALIKAGDFAAAVGVYRSLAARRLTGGDYQMRVADVLYLAHQPEKAEEQLDGILAAPDIDVSRVVAAADLARRYGRTVAARKYGERALGLVLAQPDKRSLDDGFYAAWLTDQLDTVGVAPAIARLQTVRTQLEQALTAAHPVGRGPIRKTIAQLDGLGRGALATWLGERADGATREAASPVYAAFLEESVKNANQGGAAYGTAAAAARRAQLPNVADDMQRREMADLARSFGNAAKGKQALATLVAMLRARAASEPLAPLAVQAGALTPPLPGGADFVAEAAALERAVGDFAAEKQMLARLVYYGNRNLGLAAPNAATGRYFSLLDDATLDNLATGRSFSQPGPLTVWLAQQGQTARLIAALDSQYQNKGPRWLLAKKAAAYQADPKFAADAKKAYAELLGLPLLIGTHIGVKPPPAQATDKLWTQFAFRYAEWLTDRGDEAGPPLLYAEPERQPLTATAYIRVVAALDAAKRFSQADEFLARAAMLGEGEEIAAAKARHLHAQGRDRQAADALAPLVADPKTALSAAPRYAALMAEIGRAGDAIDRWREILTGKLSTIERYQRIERIGEFFAFVQTHASAREAASVARDVLSSRRLDAVELRELIDSNRISAGAMAWTWMLALDRIGDDPQASSFVSRRLGESALEYALTFKDEKLAGRAFAALAKYYPTVRRRGRARGENSWSGDAAATVEEDDALQQQRVRAATLFDGERTAEATALRAVRGRVDEGFANTIVGILQQAEMTAAADRVWLAFYEPIRRDDQLTAQWLATVNDREFQDVGSAEFGAGLKSLAARWRLKELPAARDLTAELRQMAAGSDSMLTALATTLVENGAAADALPIVDQAAALNATSVGTARERALAYLAAGRAEDAASHLAKSWRDGLFSQTAFAEVVARAADVAVAGNARRWETAVGALASPARELATAALALRESHGDKAVQALASLGEPLRYPRTTWRLRAQAFRLTGDVAREQQALAELLRYDPADKAAARRLAWLEMARQPFAGLLRLNRLGMPAAPERLADPLAEGAAANALETWWRAAPRADRADLALAVVNAWAAIDRPAMAAVTGEAAIAALGDNVPAKLRALVAQQRQEAEKLRAVQRRRFAPTDNLTQ